MGVHQTAIVHKDAKIGKDVDIGPYSIIGGNVTIGDGTNISSHVVISSHTTIGKNNKIYEGAVIGGDPQDVHYTGEKSFVEIGDENIIREFVTINVATGEGAKTAVGNNCFLMATAHMGHNSKLGNNVVLVNGVGLGGYVEVEDRAFLSAYCPVHQFVKIGSLAMIGMSSPIEKDVPPYVLGVGNPFKIYGVNRIGLQRAGIPEEGIEKIKKIYKIMFRSELNVTQAIKKIKEELKPCQYTGHFIEFVEKSKRGIYK